MIRSSFDKWTLLIAYNLRQVSTGAKRGRDGKCEILINRSTEKNGKPNKVVIQNNEPLTIGYISCLYSKYHIYIHTMVEKRHNLNSWTFQETYIYIYIL